MSDNNEALAPEYKDILWRLNDIADMLTKEGVGGQRIYGCDEFSVPVVNLKAAIAKIETLSAAGSQSVPEGWEDLIFDEMMRRFSLSGRSDDRLVNNDTQLGVEFAIEQFKAMLAAAPSSAGEKQG